MTSGGANPENEKSEAACLDAFRTSIARSYREDFGVYSPERWEHAAQAWFHCDARHDHRFVELEARLPTGSRFLDLASGMGTAVLRGLQRGHDGFGIEPDPEKLALMRRRIDIGSFPPATSSRFARAVGERLPYKDRSFDAVLTYQTLEHVVDPSAVLAEMLRVVRPGGGLHIRCPDYTGTFEGHYLLPWLPLFPRGLAVLYLRMLGRPVAGLRGIRYVTRRHIIRRLEETARKQGVAITIEDLEGVRLRHRLRERGLPGWRGPALPWRLLYHARRLFRDGIQINLWVTVDK